MLVIPRVELILGLPRETALIFAVVGVMVLGQLAVNLAKPWIDRLLYPEDREEIAWIQTLDRRLLTSGEVRQFLTQHPDQPVRLDAGAQRFCHGADRRGAAGGGGGGRCRTCPKPT